MNLPLSDSLRALSTALWVAFLSAVLGGRLLLLPLMTFPSIVSSLISSSPSKSRSKSNEGWSIPFGGEDPPDWAGESPSTGDVTVAGRP